MTAVDWTEDRIDRMSRLWLEGRTAAQIARDLGGGATRSAVLGKLRRLGVVRLAATAPVERRRARAPAARRRSAPKPAITVAAVKPSPPIMPAPASLPSLSTLGAVRRGRCRWPLGEPGQGDLPVCGREVVRGAYCGHHASLGYQNRKLVSLETLAGLCGT